MSKYETNLPRAALGLVVGTVAGASLIELWFLSEVRDLQELHLALQAASAIFIYAAFFGPRGSSSLHRCHGLCFTTVECEAGLALLRSEPR